LVEENEAVHIFFRLVEVIESNGMDRDINTIICSFHGSTYHKWPMSSLTSISPFFSLRRPYASALSATTLPPACLHHPTDTID
jgi:hypothetical protein